VRLNTADQAAKEWMVKHKIKTSDEIKGQRAYNEEGWKRGREAADKIKLTADVLGNGEVAKKYLP
jgi:hypothetical protein